MYAHFTLLSIFITVSPAPFLLLSICLFSSPLFPLLFIHSQPFFPIFVHFPFFSSLRFFSLLLCPLFTAPPPPTSHPLFSFILPLLPIPFPLLSAWLPLLLPPRLSSLLNYFLTYSPCCPLFLPTSSYHRVSPAPLAVSYSDSDIITLVVTGFICTLWTYTSAWLIVRVPGPAEPCPHRGTE